MNSNGIRVLLVEDDVAFANLVRVQLSKVKPKVILDPAVSLERGLSRLQETIYDAVLLDLELPDSKGLETLKRVHAADSRVPIVVLSASDNDDLAIELLRTGAQEYIVKGKTQLGLLHRSIRTAIERKTAYERMLLREYHQREDFAALLAHDLKTPVSGANRIYDLLTEGWLGPLSPGQSEIIAKLKESNLSLLRMIQNMLEVYNFEQSTRQPRHESIDLLPLLVDCIHHLSETAKRNQVQIKSFVPETIGSLSGDPQAVRRLFQNVLDNAVKFSPTGGTITVTVKTSNTVAVVTIADEGSGIPSHHQAQLFERFWLGGPDTKYTASTGLGLYICKRIVQAHNGTIKCESREGRGSTFIITLPLSSKPAADVNADGESLSADEHELVASSNDEE
ncbi:MAG TPA: ATP-binding protein [Planktothrix sp.]|jgi:signal transduction histidine kinase